MLAKLEKKSEMFALFDKKVYFCTQFINNDNYYHPIV